jgi:hypothetical protein
LLLAIQRWQPKRAGFWAGVTTVFRYPSVLWTIGAALLACWKGWKEKRGSRAVTKALLQAASFFVLAVLLGGLADWATYGKFLESAGAYWGFNHPHGPVEQMFGSDSLWVYWRFFEYLLSPWVALVFVPVSLYSLVFAPDLLLFCLPYWIGHVWTPHREPRFMLPVFPILIAAIAIAIARGKLRLPSRMPKPAVRALTVLVIAQIALNFVWYPLHAWAELKSNQAALIRNYRAIESQPTRLIALGDPPIDALIPANAQWMDRKCQWHRPPITPSVADEAPSRIWLIAGSEDRLSSCPTRLDQSVLPDLESPILQRVLRVRGGAIWECTPDVLHELCPQGVSDAPPGEPTISKQLLHQS